MARISLIKKKTSKKFPASPWSLTNSRFDLLLTGLLIWANWSWGVHLLLMAQPRTMRHECYSGLVKKFPYCQQLKKDENKKILVFIKVKHFELLRTKIFEIIFHLIGGVDKRYPLWILRAGNVFAFGKPCVNVNSTPCRSTKSTPLNP